MATITFIGGGNMATAIISGLLNNGFSAEAISVIDHNLETCQRLHSQFGITSFSNYEAEHLTHRDTWVLAVKPQQIAEVAHTLRPHIHQQLVVSIAAGIRQHDLSRWLGNHDNIIRAMPNTPALIGAGITGLYASPQINHTAKLTAEHILQAVGKTLWVDTESCLDSVTALSGSGPAYVFYLLESMQQAGIALGLSAHDSEQLATQTLLGAAQLAATSTEKAQTLRERVTSKGGTTECAIQHLEETHTRTHFIDAIKLAAHRSCELGDELGQTHAK